MGFGITFYFNLFKLYMQENREYQDRVYKESVSKIEQFILKSGFKLKQVIFISDQKIWKKIKIFLTKI